jgi:hypothetical protein
VYLTITETVHGFVINQAQGDGNGSLLLRFEFILEQPCYPCEVLLFTCTQVLLMCC